MNGSNAKSTGEKRRGVTAWCLALVAVTVLALAPQTAAGSEPCIAVLDFDTSPLDGTWHYTWPHHHLGLNAGSLLTNELARSGAFCVIERDHLDRILTEQDLGQSSRFDAATAARIGELAGAQAVIFGDVASFGVKKKGGRGVVSGWKLPKILRGPKVLGGEVTTATVALSARLVESATGRVLDAFEGEGDASYGKGELWGGNGGGSFGTEFDTEQLSKVMREAVARLAKDIVARASGLALAAPRPACLEGVVATVSGGTIYLDLGTTAGVAAGDEFEVRDVEATITHPQTGEVLGHEEKKLGRIRVQEVRGERLSVARAIEGASFDAGNRVVQVGSAEPDFECRLQPPPVARAAAPAEPPRAAAEAARAEEPEADAVASAEPSDAEADESAAPRIARGSGGSAPLRPSIAVVGEWRLHVNETLDYMGRLLFKQIGLWAAVPSKEDRFSEKADPEMKQRMRDLELHVSFRTDGTFLLSMRDPADGGPSTVEGRWAEEGLFVSLIGERIDGLDQEEPLRERLKPVDGQLFGQIPKVDGQPVAAPWMMIRWPNLSGAVLVRAEVAQR